MRSSQQYLVPVTFLVAMACGGDDAAHPDNPDAPRASATAHFDPPAPGAGAAWAAIPYPSDLYLDTTGHQKLTTVPTGADPVQTSVDSLIDGLSSMTGAGLRSSVYFPVDGALSKPTVAGAAHLYDLDASTAGNLVEVAADVVYRDDLASVIVAPRIGVVLRANHHYGAILTSDAHAADDTPLAAAADFLAAIGSATPSDPGAAAAQTSLAPLLAVLPADAKGKLVSATVFRTNNDLADTVAMRTAIDAATPTITIGTIYGPAEAGATGLAALFGTAAADSLPGANAQGIGAEPHNHVALVIHGTIALPNFLSATTGEDGFATITNGVATIKSTQTVKFTLTLPAQASWTNLPVAIFVHGLGRTRQDMLTQANTASREGFAMLAIDLNRHGDRAATPTDVNNEMLGTAVPDGFGDNPGLSAPVQYFHLVGNSGGIPAGHPRAGGDNMRQSAMEVVALAEFIADGNLAPLTAAIQPIAGVPHTISFRDDSMLVTESLGGLVTTASLAVEPRITSAYVSDPAAGLPFPAMMHSPNYAQTFLGVLANPFSLDRIVLWDPEKDARFDPIIMLYDTVTERGDALAYARAATDGSLRGGTPPNLIMTMAWGDVWVPNDSTEALAAAAGLKLMPMAGTAVPPAGAALLRSVQLPTIASPVSGNLSGNRTAAFIVWNRAGHACLRKKVEERNYDPLYPPLTPLNPVEVINPTQQAEIQETLGRLYADHLAQRTVTVLDPYSN